MADINKLKEKVKRTIYPNGRGANNATDHQAMLLDMVDGMAETDAKLAKLSAETSELNGIIDSVIERGEQSINLFEPTIIGKFYTLYGNEQTNSEAKCQVRKVACGEVLRF